MAFTKAMPICSVLLLLASWSAISYAKERMRREPSGSILQNEHESQADDARLPKGSAMGMDAQGNFKQEVLKHVEALHMREGYLLKNLRRGR